MSILLKGVSMPRNCIECPCSQWEQIADGMDELNCLAYMEPAQEEGRPDYCGMVEVEDAWYSHHPQKNIYAMLP